MKKDLQNGWSIYLLITGFSLLSGGISCQSQKTEAPHQTLQIQIGKAPFKFDLKEVQELNLLKSDPNQSDHWDLTLRPQSSHWEISYDSTGKPLLDLHADETFILHLLDTFKTLTIDQAAPHGPLESFGLNPPHFAIRWKTNNKEYEFRLGASLRNNHQRFFTADGKNVWVASGAAIRLLDQITSVESLRKRTWMYTDADDIDEIELRHQGRLFLFAQREGDRWTNRRRQVVKQDLNSFVKMMTQAQIQKFIDDPSQASKIREQIHLSDHFTSTFVDRFGKRTELRIIHRQRTIYAINSTRPSSVFVLAPSVLERLNQIWKTR